MGYLELGLGLFVDNLDQNWEYIVETPTTLKMICHSMACNCLTIQEISRHSNFVFEEQITYTNPFYLKMAITKHIHIYTYIFSVNSLNSSTYVLYEILACCMAY